MDLGRVTPSETRHGFDVLPIGDCHELGLRFAILSKTLDAESLLNERSDAGLKVVLLVFVSALALDAPPPNPGNGGFRLIFCRCVGSSRHAVVPPCAGRSSAASSTPPARPIADCSGLQGPYAEPTILLSKSRADRRQMVSFR